MNKINWKLRLKNKTTLISLIAALTTLVYQLLSIYNITPRINENSIMGLVDIIIGILITLGIVIDPTTKGFGDCNSVLDMNKPCENKKVD